MSLRPAALVATLSLAPALLPAQPGPSAAGSAAPGSRGAVNGRAGAFASGDDSTTAPVSAGATLLGGYVETDGADAIAPFASSDPNFAETFRAMIRNEGPVAIHARVSITCLRIEP